MLFFSTLLFHVTVGFVVAALFYYVLQKTLNRWRSSEIVNTKSVVASALKIPLLSLPWIIFLFYILQQTQSTTYIDNETLALAKKITWILYPNWFFWSFSLHIQSWLETLKGRWISNLSNSVIARSIQLIVVITTLFGIAQIAGYSLSALMTLGGVGGIVLGFAAREWLANFFGGLMLMIDRPFAEKDWIRSPDRNIEGHVEKVGWRLTKIRTFDRRPIYVPNSIFNGIVVENATLMRNRRMIENFGVEYQDIKKLPKIFDKIMALFEKCPDADCREPYYAKFIRYEESSLLCQVRVHITRIDRVGFLDVQQSLLFGIAELVESEGANFAYPTRTIFKK